jgi:hypothetical protein
MRLIKMALLAATAAVVAMAFIGASTASATGPWIGFCKEATKPAEVLLNCKSGVFIKHPLKGQIRALAGKGFFLSNFKIECTSGEGESNAVESQQETNFEGTLESLTFTGCTGGCNTVTVGTPIAVTLNMETEAGEDWRLKAANAKVLFSGCTFGVECEFEGNLNLKVQMDEEGAYTDPEGAAFTRIKGSGLLCGNTGKWEEGRTRFDWVLDDNVDPKKATVHKNVWPSLIGANLIKTFE